MSKVEKRVSTDHADIDGLDSIFDAESVQVLDNSGRVPTDSADTLPKGAGMSLKKACIYYQMASSTLREKIKTGEIPAKKVAGPYGLAWLVYPKQSELHESGRVPAERETNISPVNIVSAQNESMNELIELVGTQATKLEAAAGQIGYLSAQIETYQNQVRLLPDLEARAERATVHEQKLSKQEEKIAKLEQELSTLKASWWYRLWHFRQSPC